MIPDNRTDAARRHDDSALVNDGERTPSQGGREGGVLQRDIATRAEEDRLIAGKAGTTRVRKADEEED